MSDHEFEKQVHQKLEELKLRPSDTVWMEVEKNIRQGKRRRRFMWLWLAALFICVTTSGYILYRYTIDSNNTRAIAKVVPSSLSNKTITETSNTSTQQASTNTKRVPENSAQTGESIEPLSPQTDNKQPVVTGDETSKEPAATFPHKEQPAIAVIEKKAPANKETFGIHNKKRVKKKHAGNKHDAGEPAGAGYNNWYTHKKQPSGKKKSAQDVIANDKETIQRQPLEVPAAHDAAADTDAARKQLFLNTIPRILNDTGNTIATNKAVPEPFNSQPLLLAPDSANDRTATAMPIQRKRSYLWHWGIVTDAGYSRIAESKLFQLRGLLGTEKYLAEDLAARSSASRDANPLINYSSAVQAAAPAKKASPIQPDFSFSAGFFVQRTLSDRFKLSLGLEYSYMSVNTQVGKREDNPITVNIGSSMGAVVPFYYKVPGHYSSTLQSGTQNEYYSQKYRYRFQYLEIPLMANWQINKGRRMPPIVFEGGFSMARLLSVRGLHFDGTKGVYYQDKELFNKTQFNLVTGLSVGLLQRSKHPVWIGPNLRYALNGLVKKEISSGQYMWSTGLSIKMLLGRL